MEQLALRAEPRSKTRTREARRLRREGRVPAVVYGAAEAESISVDATEVQRLFRHASESTIISLSTGDGDRDVLIKDYQTDRITDKLLHIDFLEVVAGRTLRTHVPLHFQGTPIGVREGGILETLLRELHVECLPRDLPESMDIDIEGLDSGDSIHVRDLDTPEGVRVLSPADQVVCLVAHRLAEEEEEEVDEEEIEEEGEDVEVPDAEA
ncbi:MAG: 50S ribosomal protein L25 [Spirochaetaceae bacterium]|nr:50S ribosomal protein L25 [Spirochaetaceae bacterium]